MSEHGLPNLVRVYRRSAKAGTPLVLATVIGTTGSTYRKAGARMLIGKEGVAAGILGGGCFDTDLAAQSRAVLEDGQPRTVTYDMRSSEEAIWGLGLGCEGLVDIFLQRQSGDESDAMSLIGRILDAGDHGRVATVVQSEQPGRVGMSWIVGDPGPVALADKAEGLVRSDDDKVFVDRVQPPLHLVVFGAGVDAVPVVEISAKLGWQVTVVDHRPGYIRADRFPGADEVVLFDAPLQPDLANADAAVVMSHDLMTDKRYLQALARTTIPYVGLLGPTNRRDRLIEALEESTDTLNLRLRAPVGLDLGGELPEEIALAVVSEIQKLRYDRTGQSLTGSGIK